MKYERDLASFIREIIDRNLHRSLKFSIAGFMGFLLAEFFTFLFFHYFRLSNLVAVTSSFLIGVAFEFLANEYWTTKNEGTHTGNIPGLLLRLMKFEITNFAGTLVAVIIQFVIYVNLGITPLIGNIIGSAVSFPINYYVQMKITWNINII